MIIYECDKCHNKTRKISTMYNLKITYAGMSKQNLINNGEFMLCGKCESQLEHMLRPMEDIDDGR